MTSKNGSPELISMLQYMKETRMDNPEIIVKDPRILELDRVVNEVKESEEWEAVRMNILEIGIEHGVSKGAKMKLAEQIKKKLLKGYNVEEIAEMLEETVEVIEEIMKELEDSKVETSKC